MPWDANLSRFGVLPAMIPRWYAPMLNQPTSSPMMNTMFGFLPFLAGASFWPALMRWVPGGEPSGQQPRSAGWGAAGLAAVGWVGGAAVAVRLADRCPAAAA